MRARLCWGIRETLCGGQVRSETRMRDCLNRVGVAIISKFPHLAPLPPPLRPHRGVRRRASRLQTSAPRTGVGFRPEIGTGAGCSGAGTGRKGLARECGTAGKTATPSPALPTRQPQAAALCLSRKMVWESLRGREGRPHHSPLNVNYAFKTVFIGEAARHPMPPQPVCVLPRPALRAARHAQVLRGGAHPVTRPSPERARRRRRGVPAALWSVDAGESHGSRADGVHVDRRPAEGACTRSARERQWVGWERVPRRSCNAQLVGPCHGAPSRVCVARPGLCERRIWHGA